MAVELKKIDTEKRNERSMHIDSMSTLDMVKLINEEDHKVAEAVAEVTPEGEISPTSESFIQSLIVSNVTGLPLSSEILTVITSLPSLEIVSVTVPVAPFTRLTRMTSAITPMMIPSMVRNARNLFPAMDFIAIFNACVIAFPPSAARP